MFNPDDYRENVDYCRYVYEQNEKLNLGLNSKLEIQNVANRYKDKIGAIRGNNDDEVYEDDKALGEAVHDFKKMISKFQSTSSIEKSMPETKSQEDELDGQISHLTYEDKELDSNIRLK